MSQKTIDIPFSLSGLRESLYQAQERYKNARLAYQKWYILEYEIYPLMHHIEHLEKQLRDNGSTNS